MAAFALACACSFAPGHAAPKDAIADLRPPLPEFRQFGLVPEVRQAMHDAGIYLADRDGTAEDGSAPPAQGDLIVLLATLTDEEKVSRWVIQLRATPNSAPSQGERSPVEVHSSTGNKWVLNGAKSSVEVTVLRPLAKRKTTNLLSSDEDARNAGLWGVVSLNLKVKEGSLEVPFRPEFSNTAFPAERVASDWASAQVLGITADEERSGHLALPALTEFLSLILSTPELSTMMARVVDLSYFTALQERNGGIAIKTLPYEKMISARQLGVAGADKAYVLPLSVSLGKKMILLCQLAFVQPQPPFQVTAGLVALAAGHPDGKGPLLTIELVSAVPAK